MPCPSCRIAAGELDAVIVHEDAELVAFLDIAPIRPAHTQIIPRRHVETFERLPPDLAARMLALGQQLARRMKAVYGVERVAFAFTGADVPHAHAHVPHAHAHVVPIHGHADITSARYLVEPAGPARPLAPGSAEEFIAEHYWGYARQRDGGTVEYRVAHPSWRTWAVRRSRLEGDLAPLWGADLAAAVAGAPDSAFLADGSAVTVYRPRRLPRPRDARG